MVCGPEEGFGLQCSSRVTSKSFAHMNLPFSSRRNRIKGKVWFHQWQHPLPRRGFGEGSARGSTSLFLPALLRDCVDPVLMACPPWLLECQRKFILIAGTIRFHEDLALLGPVHSSIQCGVTSGYKGGVFMSLGQRGLLWIPISCMPDSAKLDEGKPWQFPRRRGRSRSWGKAPLSNLTAVTPAISFLLPPC